VNKRRIEHDEAMNVQNDRRPDVDNALGSRLGRRSFLKMAAGGVVLGTAGATGIAHFTRSTPARRPATLTGTITGKVRSWSMIATDGYVTMPDPAIIEPLGVYYPDLLAPVDENGVGQNLYVFGFDDITDIAGFAASNLQAPWDPTQLVNAIDFKGLAQISAPLLYCDDGDDIRINLTNLGMATRPDLFDPHTIHWHGFANQIPYFDGVPDASLSVPQGGDLTYRYLPTDVGTYMYHCHVEDVEHVHMGLTGMVFIRTSSNSPRWAAASPALTSGQKYAYYDTSTRYDREYSIILTEANVENHWNDGHIQVSDWSEYRSTFGLMNGRSWPDTIVKNGSFFDRDAMTVAHPNGTWRNSQLSAAESLRLAHNPNSSLIQANAGETVLLRISNLGFDEHSLVLPGMQMTMVGRDAKFLGSGRPDYAPNDGTPTRDGNIMAETYRIDIGPGESRDMLFTAPAGTGSDNPDVYPFYDRSILFRKKQATSLEPLDGFGAMRTEVHVYPAGSLAPQVHPNQLF
jgi:FtsP/CotA-like multicopper oxidase with cupredoxin domain